MSEDNWVCLSMCLVARARACACYIRFGWERRWDAWIKSYIISMPIALAWLHEGVPAVAQIHTYIYIYIALVWLLQGVLAVAYIHIDVWLYDDINLHRITPR